MIVAEGKSSGKIFVLNSRQRYVVTMYIHEPNTFE